MVIQKALYYPFPFVQNEEWLKYTALYWEKLIRIIPRGFFEAYISGKRITTPTETERIFRDEFQFVEDFLVDYSDSIGEEKLEPTLIAAFQLKCFLEETKKMNRALFDEIVSDNREYYSWGVLEHSKLGYVLADELERLGAVIRKPPEYYITFREFAGRLYMMFLSSNISDKIGCPIVTDDEEHDTLLKISSLLTATRGMDDWNIWMLKQIRFNNRKQKKINLEALACLNFKSVGIKNLDQVPPEKIVTFRKKYDEERFVYLDSLFKLIEELGTVKIRSEKQLNDLLVDRSRRINQNCKDVECALRGLNLQTIPYLIGISTTIPLLSELSKVISISNPILTVGATTIGIIGILLRTKVEREKTFIGNRAGAYLFHLKEEFKKSSYPQRLIKKLTKFLFG